MTNGHFDTLEHAQSINTKELLAIWFAILSFCLCCVIPMYLLEWTTLQIISYMAKMDGMNDLFNDYIAKLIAITCGLQFLDFYIYSRNFQF